MNRYSILFLLLCSFLSASASQHSQDEIHFLPGFGAIKDIEYAGYLPVSQSANLFYWYVENKEHRPQAPLVLWLNGGPGAASLYGFFMENGPYVVNKDLTLSTRPYSWNQKANYLIIDQPAGTGFSYGEENTYANEAEAMDQLYNALTIFFQQHPELASSPLYLAGQSYAGKYLPQLAVRILAGNSSAKQTIPLKGLLIGDGWVNPRLQQKAIADFAYSHGLIDRNTHAKVHKLYQQCIKELDKTSPSSPKANQLCERMQKLIKNKSGHPTLTNVHKGKEPSDQNMIQYLNKPEVRKALHIDQRIEQFKNFSSKVASQLEIGEQNSVATLYPQLLAAGISVLIYNGIEDGTDSNFMGTDLWLSALQWPFQKEFANAATCVWHSNNQVAGYVKQSGGLTQVKIRNAGHLAPIDQPARLLDLLNRFINHQSLCSNA